MRKFTLCPVLLVIILFGQSISAQLYVSPASYVYVNNQYVTVTQGINLQNNGNIYLRGEGQLLQKTAGSSTNSGTGVTSLFQEGTTNSYAYNYWCSPVGNTALASGNESFGITMLKRPNGIITSDNVHIISSPSLDGYTTGSDLYVADRWIFKYLRGTTYANWQYVGATTALAAGEGFTMKGTVGTDGTTVLGVSNSMSPGGLGQRYDFRGRPNDGNINISVEAGKRTLTGNPYPSAIDLKRFLTTGASPNNPTAGNSTGVAYFWDQDKTTNSHYLAAYRGGYGIYSPIGGTNDPTYGTMGVYTPAVFYAYNPSGTQIAGSYPSGLSYQRRFCPVGQGFMIEGNASVVGVGSVTMSNDFRVYLKENPSYSAFARNAGPAAGENPFLPAIPSVAGFDYTTVSTKPCPQIRFNTLLDNQGLRQVALVFHPDATDAADHAMDAKSMDTANASDMYFVINNEEYLIDVVDFNIYKRIPIGFKNAAEARFKIAVAEILNFEGAENVYIHDKVSDTYFDIKSNDYELMLPAGVNNTQYEITFVANALGIPALNADTFDMVQNNESQTLTIANPKMIDIKSVSLYDIGGKQIFNKTGLGAKASYQFSTASVSDAIYVLKITTTDNQESSTKITVYNGK
jgi:hypothetical protein